MSADPALGSYLPQAGQDGSNLPGEGGVFNPVNLNLYHYAGNNPIKYVDPDGEKQNLAQKVFSAVLNVATKIEPIKNFVHKITTVQVTRDVYKGIETKQGVYFKDKMSVKIGPILLNSVQVQSRPDVPNQKPLSDGDHSGKLGVNGSTNPFIVDAIQIDNSAYFIHDNWADFEKPYSKGCIMTVDHADMTEIKDVLRKDLKFRNLDDKDTVKINIQQNKKEGNNENIKKKK